MLITNWLKQLSRHRFTVACPRRSRGPIGAALTSECRAEYLEDRTLLAAEFGYAAAFGSSGFDSSWKNTTDGEGNVFTVGTFQGTVDFDPGSGTANLVSDSGSNDVFLSKLDNHGNYVWAKRIGGSGSDYGQGVVTDLSGNVYFTGYFEGAADFDPGPNVVNLSSAGSVDVFVSKFDSDGNFAWAKQFGGSGDDLPRDIAVDSAGNVHTIGYFAGTADFAPGPGTFNLTSFGGDDAFASKLDNNGNFVWARQLGGSGFDIGNGISVDAAGNVYVGGLFSGTADFDPGVSTFNLTTAGAEDYFLTKLDSGGNFVWANRTGGAGRDFASDVTVDAAGNVYEIGFFKYTVDFDPGTGVFNLTSPGGNQNNVSLTKFDSNGDFIWAKNLTEGPAVNEQGNGAWTATLDNEGAIYTVGQFKGTPDFDPGPGTFNLTSAGADDAFVSKLDSSGNFVWARRFGGSGSDIGLGVSVDASGNVNVAGQFDGSGDYDPGPGVVNLTSAGGKDAFLVQLTQKPSVVITDDGDPGFTSYGFNPASGQGFLNDVQFASAGAGGSVAAWTFNDLTPGQYRVSATWSTHVNRATNAPFTVLDGSTSRGTVLVNQEQLTNSREDAGAIWQDLGSSFAITGTTLVVRLTNNANEYVIADGIRIERLGDALPVAPEVTVLDGSTNIDDGTGSVTFGTTAFNTPVQRTFTVRNDGGADLTVQPVSVPAGFSVVTNIPTDTVLAPGLSISFVVQMDATAAGDATGELSFANDDLDENPFNFTISGTVTPAPTVFIKDDGDSGFTSYGFNAFSGQGYLNDIQYAAAGSGGSVATWTFNDLLAGEYRVSATWSTHANRATNAPFTVYDGSIARGTVSVNQEQLTANRTDAGANWQDLGSSFAITGTTLVVLLTNNANEYVIADGIRIERLGDAAPPAPEVTVLDDIVDIADGLSTVTFGSTAFNTPVQRTFTVRNDGGANLTVQPVSVPTGFSVVTNIPTDTVLTPGASISFVVRLDATVAGTFSGALSFANDDSDENPFNFTISGTVTSVPAVAFTAIKDDGDAGFTSYGFNPASGQGYLSDVQFASAGAGGYYATWTFSGLTAGTYRVSATWSTHANRATNSPYTVYDGATNLGTVSIDQELAPNDRVDAGANWEDLGSFVITGTTLVVRLTNNANEYVIADGIRIELIGTPLLAAGGAVTGSHAGVLTDAQLQPVVAAAITRMGQQGFDTQLLSTVAFSISDLPGEVLGLATPQGISIDVNAAGHGWFVDATPLDDGEFAGGVVQTSAMDLLSVVMHELGHTTGLVDLYDADHASEIMAGYLQPGTRRDDGTEHADSEPIGSPQLTTLPVTTSPVATESHDLFASGDAVIDVSRNAMLQQPVNRLSTSMVKIEDPDLRDGLGPIPESETGSLDMSSAAIDDLFLDTLDPARAFHLFS